MQDFPHVVEIAAPADGFGKWLDDMHTFHAARGIQSHHGGWRRERDQEFVRWCFADVNTAAAFATMFGGVVCKPT